MTRRNMSQVHPCVLAIANTVLHKNPRGALASRVSAQRRLASKCALRLSIALRSHRKHKERTGGAPSNQRPIKRASAKMAGRCQDLQQAIPEIERMTAEVKAEVDAALARFSAGVRELLQQSAVPQTVPSKTSLPTLTAATSVAAGRVPALRRAPSSVLPIIPPETSSSIMQGVQESKQQDGRSMTRLGGASSVALTPAPSELAALSFGGFAQRSESRVFAK